VSHRLLVRYHDGIMTACRLQCIDLEGETARACEERGTRRTAGHRAMGPNGSDDAMGTFKVARASRAVEPAPRLWAWDVPPHWGAGVHWGGTRGARLGRGRGRWSKGGLPRCESLPS
jgi:hypothetical protein